MYSQFDNKCDKSPYNAIAHHILPQTDSRNVTSGGITVNPTSSQAAVHHRLYDH